MPKLVEYGESVIEFPDDASEAQILEVLNAHKPTSAATLEPQPKGVSLTLNPPPLSTFDASVLTQPPSVSTRSEPFYPRFQLPVTPPNLANPQNRPFGEPRLNLAGAVPEVKPDDSPAAAGLKTLAQNVLSIPDFMSSDLGQITAGLSTLPGVRNLIGAGFAADMFGNAKTILDDATQNWEQMTPAQRMQARVNLASNVAMGLAAAGVPLKIRSNVLKPLKSSAVGETVARIPSGPEGAVTAAKILENQATQPREVPVEVSAVPPVGTTQQEKKTATAEAVTASGQAPAETAASAMQAGREAPMIASQEASARAHAALEQGVRKVEEATKPVEEVTPDAQEVQRKEAVTPESTPPARGTETTTASPVAETPPTTTPSEAGGGVKPTTTIAEAWEKYDGTGEIETVSDLADTVQSLIDSGQGTPKLKRELDRYLSDKEEDFTKYGGRGDMESAETRFTKSVESEAKKKPKKPAPTSPPAPKEAGGGGSCVL